MGVFCRGHLLFVLIGNKTANLPNLNSQSLAFTFLLYQHLSKKLFWYFQYALRSSYCHRLLAFSNLVATCDSQAKDDWGYSHLWRSIVCQIERDVTTTKNMLPQMWLIWLDCPVLEIRIKLKSINLFKPVLNYSQSNHTFMFALCVRYVQLKFWNLEHRSR